MNHFYLDLPESVMRLTDDEAIKEYAARASAPAAAIEGLSPEQLLSFPVPGTWSIQQIIAHLVDGDAIALYRMQRVVAEENPELDLFDESAFAERLYCDRLNINSLCKVFQVSRELAAEWLRQLPSDAFQRVARHREAGSVTLGLLVRAVSPAFRSAS